MNFPPSSLDDLIDFFAHEKLSDRIKSWHLHSRTISQNFRKFGSGDFELLPFFSSDDPTDKNAFGQFGWFSREGSQIFVIDRKLQDICTSFHFMLKIRYNMV